MKKARDFIDRLTGRIGRGLFPGMDEETGKRRAAWLLILLLALAVAGLHQYRVMHELRQYRRILDTYSILFR